MVVKNITNNELILLLENLIKKTIDSYFLLFNTIGEYIYNFYFYNSRIILDFINIGFKYSFKFLLYLTIILAFFYMIMGIYVLFKKKRIEYPGIRNGEEPKVTIQIPTYNELAALNCARKCIDFDYPKEKMQIIIGDDSSNKLVSKKIDEFAKENNILVTRRGENIGFKPGNLKHMLKYTTGEIIVIFDSDFLPERDFLKRIIAPYVYDKQISVVQARWKIHNYSQNLYSILGGTISLLTHYIVLPFIKSMGGNTSLCGSAESIRKNDLEEVGGWRLGMLTEDIECSFRLIKKQKKIIYLEDLECKCEAPHIYKDLRRQQMRWAYGVITALKLHLKDILTKPIKISDKLAVLTFSSGYMFSSLILALTLFGTMSILSSSPAPIDWPRFLSETFRNIALTSGFLVASVISLVLAKKSKLIPKMIIASLSVGLAVTYYVNIGVIKAIYNRGMQWFILKKIGNESVLK
jgi:cellulose synthase/poly-beta-1,6-N-acetylglucosamine synthase-like glycosyltransferase